MMKIAASDFDGTLNIHGQGVSASDIAAIRRWRAAGHKFGLATGRGLGLLMRIMRRYEVPFDFLVCMNGAVLLDENLNILQSRTIPQPVLSGMLDLPLLRRPEIPMLFFTAREIFAFRPEENATVPEIDEEGIRNLRNATQVSMKFPTLEETLAGEREICQAFPNMLGGNINRFYLDVNLWGVNKCQGLKDLQGICHWEDSPVLVIGDDKNDLPMIQEKAFCGCTVQWAQDFLHEAADRVYASVGEMLDDNR